MKNNIVRVIPNGTHEVTIEYFSNPKRKDIGNQEEFQELSLQYYIDKVSIDNPFCEESREDWINIIFELNDGTLFEPLPIKNTLQKGSVLRGYFESLGYDDIKEMRKFDDETYIKSKLIIEAKKVSRRYRKNECNTKNKTFQISKIVSMVCAD